ncbi:hypothetical protein BH24ACT1_BH24ACT1_04790 [soil metagenome]
MATTPTEPGDADTGRKQAPSGATSKKGRKHRTGVFVAVAVGVWAVVAAVTLAGAVVSARAGLATLEEVREDASVSTLGSPQDDAVRLRDAEAHFDTARARVRSLAVSPLRALPVVGRQLRSVDHLSDAAGEVAGTAADALGQIRDRLEGGLPSGPDRAGLLADMAEVAGGAEERLAAVDLGPDEGLIGPLAEGRSRAANELAELQESAQRARVGGAGMAELFAGNSTLLLLLGNNAEMRAGSGMFLTVGTVTVSEGRLSVGEIVPTYDFQLPESVPVEGDLADRWGWLEPGREWRNLGISPRFDVTAPLAARMWAQARGQTVDGVLAVDVVALEAMLRATGPVEVEGQTIDADTVVQDLLHDQYVGLDSQDEVAQAERRGRLGGVARAALEALERPELDGALLAEELAGAARGRHLLAWSSEPVVQQGWEAMSLDGALDSDDFLVAVLNRGGNKLDPYLEVTGNVTVEPGPDATAVTVEVTLENTVTADEPPYILGPSPPLLVAPGTYVGLVTATLPGAAGSGRFEGVESLAVAGADGPTRVVTVAVEVPMGEERSLTLRFELPPGPGALDVLSSARMPAISWRWHDRSWEDDHPEEVAW